MSMPNAEPVSTEDEIGRLAAVIDEHRRLIAESPDTLYPAYADALMALAMCLAERKQAEEALAAAVEGVAHWQALAEAEPADFGVHLASGLNNLSNRLSESGRDEEARQAGVQAVELARAAIADRPEQGRFVLISTLLNQAGRSWASGRGLDALGEMGEATEVFREGGDAMAPHLGGMIEALHRNAMAYGEAGLWSEAIAVRRLVARCFNEPPPAVFHLLALTLERAAQALEAAEKPGEALAMQAEAAQHAEALAKADPDRYRTFLAQTLSTLAIRHFAAGSLQEAMNAAVAAIEEFQKAAETNAASVILPLALTLETFAEILRAMGHDEHAATVLAQRDELTDAMEKARAYAEGLEDEDDAAEARTLH